jgi:hypothetical protein
MRISYSLIVSAHHYEPVMHLAGCRNGARYLNLKRAKQAIPHYYPQGCLRTL